MKRQIWSIVFSALNHIFAWVAPLIFIAAVYGPLLTTSAGSITFFGLIGLTIALRFILFRMKDVAENGFGLSKEIAKEFRYLIPILLILAAVFLIQMNVAGIITILKFTLFMNIPAVAMRLISYRLSNRYLNDVAPKRAVELLEEQKGA